MKNAFCSPLRDALQQLFDAPVAARAHDHFFFLEPAQVPAPRERAGRCFGLAGEADGAVEEG